LIFGKGDANQVDLIFENIDKDNNGSFCYDGRLVNRIYFGGNKQEESDYCEETGESV
jgi:hypothetical protein